MMYVGKEVCVPKGQYKNTKGIITGNAQLKQNFTITKDDGTKIKVPYKDMFTYNFTSKRKTGDLALLRKSIMVDGVKQSFTFCEILYRLLPYDRSKNHMYKLIIKTVNDDVIEVNCNAVIGLEL